MRRRPSVLLTGTAAVLIGVSVAASSAQVNTSSADASPQRVTLLSADPNAVPDAPVLAPVPETPRDAIVGLDVRARQAVADAAKKGADIGFTLLDRTTGRTISGGDGGAFPIASVSKLFIADDLLLQVAKGQRQLTPAERQAFDVMLRSSDDNRGRDLLERERRQRRHLPGEGPLRAERDHGALRRPLVDHHEHHRRPGPLLLQAARRHRRVAARAGRHHPVRPVRLHADRRWTDTRSGSAFPTGCSTNPLRSNRVGCRAGTAATGCTCRPG